MWRCGDLILLFQKTLRCSCWWIVILKVSQLRFIMMTLVINNLYNVWISFNIYYVIKKTGPIICTFEYSKSLGNKQTTFLKISFLFITLWHEPYDKPFFWAKWHNDFWGLCAKRLPTTFPIRILRPPGDLSGTTFLVLSNVECGTQSLIFNCFDSYDYYKKIFNKKSCRVQVEIHDQ